MYGGFSNAVHVDQLGLIGVALQPSAQAFVVQGFTAEDYYAQVEVLRSQRLFRRSRGVVGLLCNICLRRSFRAAGGGCGPLLILFIFGILFYLLSLVLLEGGGA